MKPALLAQYRDAQYRMLLPRGELLWHIGRTPPRAQRLLRAAGCRHHWFILTPCNPRSRLLPAGANRHRLNRLRQQLRQRNWRHHPSRSSAADGGWPEPGFAIFDAPRAAVLALARRYGQNAVAAGGLGQAATLISLR